MNLNEQERAFINLYQGGFPVIEQPYRAVAASLCTSENALLKTIHGLLEKGILSRFGPLYDAVKLGGGLTLAAMSVPDHDYDRITGLVNAFAEVAHNYRREHELNMWFVLATPSPADIDTTLARIEQASGLKVYNFPKQHEFYVGLWLSLDDDSRATTVPLPASMSTLSPAPVHCSVDELDKKIINATQAGLPLDYCPYQVIAEQCDCGSEEVKQRLRQMLSNGIIRRIGAVPNHYRLGLKANGMSVWDVADEKAMELGRQIGRLDCVSHCYLRPRQLPQWRYNLFAMIHGRSRDEVNMKAELIAGILGNRCRAHETLYSSAILKKTGMRLAA